ncbi:MAG: S-adenosylmethionine decarboxylase [Candidatus Dependentiae bacterium]
MKELLLLSMLFAVESESRRLIDYYPQPTYSKSKPKAWATHTSIDLHNCLYSIMRSKHEVKRFLRKLCNHLGVTPYGDPEFLYHYSGNGYTAGLSAVQQANGHTDITIRVNESGDNMHIDVFSCKSYDPYDIADKAQRFFDAYDMTINVSYRK